MHRWKATFWLIVALVGFSVRGFAATDYIVAAQRNGVIQFIDPETLKPLSTIRVDISPSSTGLNGVFADPDGHTIYVEGPIGANEEGANNCCWLYSIDLATLQIKVVAGIWGTHSRRAFISAGTGLLRPISSPTESAIDEHGADRWQASPDGRWSFGLRNGPTLDLYDVVQGRIARSFAAPNGNELGFATGTWLGNHFFVYAINDRSGRLWTLTPESTTLGDGVSTPELGLSQLPGCTSNALPNIVIAGDRLVLYEIFGSKIDRRERCADVPGGAWILDPATGHSLTQVASDLHFWMMLPNRAGSELFGLTSELPNSKAPVKLVRVDVHSGRVLQHQYLDGDRWWITIAPLRVAPSGESSMSLPAGESR